MAVFVKKHGWHVKQSSPSPLWGHCLPVTALALSFGQYHIRSSGSSHNLPVSCLILFHPGWIYSSTTYAYVWCSLSLLRWEQFTECTRVSSSQIALQSHCNYYLQSCNPSSCHLFQKTAQLDPLTPLQNLHFKRNLAKTSKRPVQWALKKLWLQLCFTILPWSIVTLLLAIRWCSLYLIAKAMEEDPGMLLVKWWIVQCRINRGTLLGNISAENIHCTSPPLHQDLCHPFFVPW